MSASATPLIETGRLRLFEMSADSAADAAFMLRVLNDPGFIRYIADRGIRTLEQAHAYLRERIVPNYAHGHGMLRVELKGSGEAIGNCGLVRREGLDGPDIGYAFLPEHAGQGYAREAAQGVVDFARRQGHKRLLAIVNPDNAASIRLLQHLRFGFERMATLPWIGHDVKLFVLDLET